VLIRAEDTAQRGAKFFIGLMELPDLLYFDSPSDIPYALINKGYYLIHTRHAYLAITATFSLG